jgi:HAMP domain-containing protein
MTLRLRLILLTTVVVTVLFGISEWLSFRNTAALLDQHEAILRETADHTVALRKLEATRNSMFVSATTVRILHAVGTLLIAVAILNYVWYRVVYRPIQRLLSHINVMRLGTWHTAIPVTRNDEIGQLETAFNDLGEQLQSNFRSISASSKLAAMALIGHRILRPISSIRSQLAVSVQNIERRNDRGIHAGVEILGAVDNELGDLSTNFQKAFEPELAAAATVTSQPAGDVTGPVSTQAPVR